MSRVVELFAFAVIVTDRIWLDVLSWKEIALFRLLAVRWGFLVSVEVCSDETFEKYAESPGPTSGPFYAYPLRSYSIGKE